MMQCKEKLEMVGHEARGQEHMDGCVDQQVFIQQITLTKNKVMQGIFSGGYCLKDTALERAEI